MKLLIFLISIISCSLASANCHTLSQMSEITFEFHDDFQRRVFHFDRDVGWTGNIYVPDSSHAEREILKTYRFSNAGLLKYKDVAGLEFCFEVEAIDNYKNSLIVGMGDFAHRNHVVSDAFWIYENVSYSGDDLSNLLNKLEESHGSGKRIYETFTRDIKEKCLPKNEVVTQVRDGVIRYKLPYNEIKSIGSAFSVLRDFSKELSVEESKEVETFLHASVENPLGILSDDDQLCVEFTEKKFHSGRIENEISNISIEPQ